MEIFMNGNFEFCKNPDEEYHFRNKPYVKISYDDAGITISKDGNNLFKGDASQIGLTLAKILLNPDLIKMNSNFSMGISNALKSNIGTDIAKSSKVQIQRMKYALESSFDRYESEKILSLLNKFGFAELKPKILYTDSPGKSSLKEYEEQYYYNDTYNLGLGSSGVDIIIDDAELEVRKYNFGSGNTEDYEFTFESNYRTVYLLVRLANGKVSDVHMNIRSYTDNVGNIKEDIGEILVNYEIIPDPEEDSTGNHIFVEIHDNKEIFKFRTSRKAELEDLINLIEDPNKFFIYQLVGQDIAEDELYW